MKRIFLFTFLLCAFSINAQLNIGNTDRQKITDFSLNGNTLNLTIENGGTKSLDLTPILGGGTGTGTDNQNITDLSLSGNVLSITIEDGNTTTLDLTPLLPEPFYIEVDKRADGTAQPPSTTDKATMQITDDGTFRVAHQTDGKSWSISPPTTTTNARFYNLPNKNGTFALLDDISGGTDNSLSEQNQTITTIRTINTASSGYLSISQEGTELFRVGNNNDNAVRIDAIEALSGSEIVTLNPLVVPDAVNANQAVNKGQLDAISVGGISTENQQKIDNANIVRRIIVSADNVIESLSNSETQDAPFEGKVETIINGDYTYLLNNTAKLNKRFTIKAGAGVTDSVYIKRNSTDIKFTFKGKDLKREADEIDGFYLQPLETAVGMRTANNAYDFTANAWSFTELNGVTNLYPYSDAVGTSDSNNVTNWSTASTTKAVESSNTNGENYALSSTATSDVSGNSYTYIDLSNLFTVGRTYRFTLIVDEGTCNDLRWYTAPEGGGSFIQSQSFSGTGYQTYTYDWVADATGIRHMLYHLGSPSIGEIGYLASLLIEDITT